MTNLYGTAGASVAAYDTAGRRVFGPAGGAPVNPPAGPVLNIITNASAMGTAAKPHLGGADGSFAETVHQVLVDVDQPVLEWHSGGRPSSVGGTFRAALSVDSGPWRSLTWDGQSSTHIPAMDAVDGVTVTSDPAPLTAHAGAMVRILAWIDSDGTPEQTVPSDLLDIAEGGVSIGGWTTDPMLYPADQLSWSLRPSAMLAPSDQSSWLITGDSNADGVGFFPEVAAQGLGVAYIKSTQGARRIPEPRETPGDWQNLVAPHLPNVTHVIDQYGGNNAAPGVTWQDVAPIYMAYWQALRDAGVQHIIRPTITVTAQTTDNWATLEGQTPTDHGQSRWDISQWLLAGAPYINGTPVAAGTPGATTCRVVQDDGTVTPGVGDHLVAGVSNIRLEHPDDPLCWSPQAMALMAAVNQRDGIHAPRSVHALSGQRLARDMRALGY